VIENSLTKGFQDLFHKKIIQNPLNLQSVNKQIEQFNKQTQDSWEQLLNLLQTTFMELEEKVIETNIQEGSTYRTTIFLKGNRKMEFPNPVSSASDEYWLHHNKIADETLALQNEIIMKVIDTKGSTIQKVVNPISFSTDDRVSLASLFKK